MRGGVSRVPLDELARKAARSVFAETLAAAQTAKDTIATWQPREHYVATVEALVFTAVLAGGLGSHDHFTWWGLAIVLGYDAGIVASKMAGKWCARRIRRPVYAQLWFRRTFWAVPALCELVIALGVMLMSARGCELLAELYYENKALYIVGNFAVHYWPLIRLLLFLPDPGPYIVRQALLAVSIIVTYTLYFQPRHIYKCPTSRASTVLGLIVPVAVIGVGAYFWPKKN